MDGIVVGKPKKMPDHALLREYIHYDPTTGDFVWKQAPGVRKQHVGRAAGCFDAKGYRIIQFRGKQYKAHRIAWAIMCDEPVPDVIDHINCNPSDNRWENLRASNQSLNTINLSSYPNNSTGYRGVTWNKQDKRFKAGIGYKGKYLYLGYFKTAEEASEVYEKKRLELYGEEYGTSYSVNKAV